MNDTARKRILLIGCRGCGKTTVGKRLAEMLEWDYLSTDQLIEEKEQMQIGKIVEEKGWDYFRKSEADVVRELHRSQNSVIDAGGGVVIEHPMEIEKLLNSTMVVWIDANLQDVIARLKNDDSRPLLVHKDPVDDIRFNYEKRRPVYEDLTELRFNTSLESVEEICDRIIKEMRQL